MKVELTKDEARIVEQLLSDEAGELISIRENIVASRASNDIRTIEALKQHDQKFTQVLTLLAKFRNTVK